MRCFLVIGWGLREFLTRPRVPMSSGLLKHYGEGGWEQNTLRLYSNPITFLKEVPLSQSIVLASTEEPLPVSSYNRGLQLPAGPAVDLRVIVADQLAEGRKLWEE